MYRWTWHCPVVRVRERFIQEPAGNLSTTPP